MAIGDVWRCACSGFVGPFDGDPNDIVSTWVNVFHLRSLTGAGSDDEEAGGIVEALQSTYQFQGANRLFGANVFLTKIVTDKQGDAYTKEFPLTVPLGDDGFSVLPTQVSIAVTGRSDEIGRRVTLYFAGITSGMLGQWGELAPIDQLNGMTDVFATKFGAGFSWNCVMFDRKGVLPTLIIDLYRVSSNWRTQRRRVLTAENSFSTVYKPVGGI